MKRYTIVLAVVAGFILSGRAQAEFFDGVKLGTGILWSDSSRPTLDAFGGGIHLSADFRPVQSFIVTPFGEVYAGDKVVKLAGGSLSLAIPMRDFETHILFIGGSAGFVSLGGASETFVSGHLGYKFPLNERFGLFFLGKYIQAKNNVMNSMSAQIGLTYALFQKRGSSEE